MPIPRDTPFLYRFRSTKDADGSLKVYGPRPFEQVIEYYASVEECEARPACGPDDSWRPMSAWTEHYEPPPVTERQLKRLANLGVSHDPDISKDEARRLVREAEALLPPTKGLREKARAAGVTVSEADTRSSLKSEIEEAELLGEVARLRKLGAQIDDDASWEELSDWEDRAELEKVLKRQGLSFEPGTSLAELEEAEYLLDDLKEAAAHARRAGIRYKVEKGMDVREARVHAEALWTVGDLYEQLELACDGRRGSPKKAELKEALERLVERMKSGAVSKDEAEEWVESRLGLRDGCLALLAFLFPFGVAVGAVFGVAS